MHRHSDDEVPDGYIPILAEYDRENETFCVTICLDGLHVCVEVPVQRPQTLGLLAKVAPGLAEAVVTVLVQSVDMGDEMREMKEKLHSAMGDLEAAERFIRQLRDIAPDEIVRAAQEDGEG